MTHKNTIDSGHKILVIGAGSSIGKRLVKRLSAKGADIVCFSRNATRAFKNAPITAIDGDIGSLDAVVAAAQGCTHLINCAVSYAQYSPQMTTVNVDGARNAAIAAHRAGAERVVHISSLSVYPHSLTHCHRESDSLQRVFEPYQIVKQQGEKVFVDQCRADATRWVIIRPGAMFGPDTTWSSKAMEVLPWQWGNGKGTFFAVHIDDVAELIEITLTHENAVNQVFNAAMEPPPNALQVWNAHAALRETPIGRRSWKSKWIKYASLPGLFMPGLYHGKIYEWYMLTRTKETWSTEKAWKLLNWRAATSLEESVQKYAESFCEH